MPIYPFVILLLLFPGRLWAIAVFAFAHDALLTLDLPAAANHWERTLMAFRAVDEDGLASSCRW